MFTINKSHLDMKTELYNNKETGVALLNAINPDWRNIVKKKLEENPHIKFYMGDYRQCVIGLLYEDYYSSMFEVFNFDYNKNDDDTYTLTNLLCHCGFELDSDYRNYNNYQILTDFWLEELK